MTTDDQARDRERLEAFGEGWDAGRRDLVATRRWGTHYESLPHDNCYDPIHCDCECGGCAPVKIRRESGAM